MLAHRAAALEIEVMHHRITEKYHLNNCAMSWKMYNGVSIVEHFNYLSAPANRLRAKPIPSLSYFECLWFCPFALNYSVFLFCVCVRAIVSCNVGWHSCHKPSALYLCKRCSCPSIIPRNYIFYYYYVCVCVREFPLLRFLRHAGMREKIGFFSLAFWEKSVAHFHWFGFRYIWRGFALHTLLLGRRETVVQMYYIV